MAFTGESFQWNATLHTISPLLSSIRHAKGGSLAHKTCHPDYIKNVEDISVFFNLGEFPNNISVVHWAHVGFVGSMEGGEPSNHREITTLLQLMNGAYLLLQWHHVGEKDCVAEMGIRLASMSYSKILEAMPSLMRTRFHQETIFLSHYAGAESWMEVETTAREHKNELLRAYAEWKVEELKRKDEKHPVPFGCDCEACEYTFPWGGEKW